MLRCTFPCLLARTVVQGFNEGHTLCGEGSTELGTLQTTPPVIATVRLPQCDVLELSCVRLARTALVLYGDVDERGQEGHASCTSECTRQFQHVSRRWTWWRPGRRRQGRRQRRPGRERQPNCGTVDPIRTAWPPTYVKSAMSTLQRQPRPHVPHPFM